MGASQAHPCGAHFVRPKSLRDFVEQGSHLYPLLEIKKGAIGPFCNFWRRRRPPLYCLLAYQNIHRKLCKALTKI